MVFENGTKIYVSLLPILETIFLQYKKKAYTPNTKDITHFGIVYMPINLDPLGRLIITAQQKPCQRTHNPEAVRQ